MAFNRRVGIDNDTYIRDLPYSTVTYLSSLLDPDQLWKQFIVHVPKCVDSLNFEERYSFVQVRVIEERGNRINGSPTKFIICDWGIQNARVKHLLQALTKARLYAAAAFVNNSFL